MLFRSPFRKPGHVWSRTVEVLAPFGVKFRPNFDKKMLAKMTPPKCIFDAVLVPKRHPKVSKICPKSMSKRLSPAKTSFSNICNTLHTKTLIFNPRRLRKGSFFGSRGAQERLLQRACGKGIENHTLWQKCGPKRGPQKYPEGKKNGAEKRP